MNTRSKKGTNLRPGRRVVALLLLSGVCFLLPTVATRAQTSTASVNGTVLDSTGAVVPEAHIDLTNTETSLRSHALTDSAGLYVLVNILPGKYRLEVSKAGFKTIEQPEFTLQVNQTATFNFTLQVGTTTETISVEAQAPLLQSSTAEVGAVVEERQVVDLPLNGRNFTQLLELTPGVSPINVSQSNGGFGSSVTFQSEFTFPAVNGQNNRSNMYLLDGVNNYSTFTSTYAVAPIIDTIQEFKVQSHMDQAEFGGVVGGMVNLVTKSGTNQLHGSVWEFLRNDALDARNTFLSKVTPFRENMFGVAGGGPVVLPKLYNGRNKTFFYGAYQGFRYSQPAFTQFRVPTAANLAGDLSDDPRQIYNPYTTRPDPNNPGQFIRDPFPHNQIPASLIDPNMVKYAQTILPAPEFPLNSANANALDTTPIHQSQREFQIRVDQNLGNKNSLWFRWSSFHQDGSGSGGLPSLAQITLNEAHNWGISYVHTFSPTTVLQAQYGALNLVLNRNEQFRSTVPENIDSQLGFNTLFTRGFIGFPGRLFPNLGVPNWWSGGEGASDYTISNIKEWLANVTKVSGKHTIKFGGGFATNSYHGICYLTTECFATPQTGNPATANGTGSELASFLLGLPNHTFRFDGPQSVRFGGIMSYYLQDQWKLSEKLTVNVGLRYDATFIPPFGTKAYNNEAIGNYDLNTGDYVVQVPVPACNQTGVAPCFPGDGTLPAHVRVSKNGKLLDNWTNNWQPRLGFAYGLQPKTVVRGAFGMVFDNWAGVAENAESAVGLWPSVGFFNSNNVNNNLAVKPLPNIMVENPFPGQTLLPPPTPFGNQSWFIDPHERNAYSMQWNLGVQHEFGPSTVLTANYVGSGSRRLPLGGFYNTATTPGPGDPSKRYPYPYITPTYYDRSWGRSDYNALQMQLNRRSSKGLTYLVSYTYSKVLNYGADGFYGAEGTFIQDPYHWRNDRSVAGFDLTHILSFNWVYDLPVGPGREYNPGNRVLSHIVGNWQFNGIANFTTGPPYSLCVEGDIANTSNVGQVCAGYERPNYAGQTVNLAHQSTAEWFNPSAFVAPPPFTFGQVGRNTMRSDGLSNLDLSVFRRFPLWSEQRNLEFRAEFFNAFNIVNYAAPNSDFSSATFGKVTSTYVTNRPRQIQFGLKIIF